MSLRHTLLRVLLSIGLVLNGPGFAWASAQMQMPMGHEAMAMHHAPGPSSPLSIDAKQGSPGSTPCPEHAQDQTAAAHAQTSGSASGDLSSESTPDCCKSGACRCACMHGASAAIPIVSSRESIPKHAPSVHPLKSGHASPVLAHLIRPPIG